MTLRTHAADIKKHTLHDLFDADPSRVAHFTTAACGLYLDTSKQLWGRETLDLLQAQAETRDVAGWINACFSGEPVNTTEGRPALHTALRTDDKAVANVQAQMRDLVQHADRKTLTGHAVETIIHIGTGGSALGPQLVIEALSDAASRPVRFLANIDGADLARTMRGLNPATTFVVIASKTFTTFETMAQAAEVRTVMQNALGDQAMRHFIAATAAPEKAGAWGVPSANILPFWDWVGGRFSLWSSVGVTIALSLGWGAFTDMLKGAAAMDEHVRTADARANLPLHLALLEVWQRSYLGYPGRAVAPYASRLQALVPYLQQLEMESNGKGVAVDGTPLPAPAAGITWGGVGTTAQHAFFQSLHQGVEVIPVEFILVANGARGDGPPEMQRALLANGLAQAAALMTGKPDTNPHKAFAGNRPSTTVVLEALTPATLGSLLAMYEHKTTLAARLWGINPFDQWGVELGKAMAATICPRLQGLDGPSFDASTEALITHIRTLRPRG